MTLKRQSPKLQPHSKKVPSQKSLVSSPMRHSFTSQVQTHAGATGDSKKPVGVIVSVNVVCVLKHAGCVPATLYKVLHPKP